MTKAKRSPKKIGSRGGIPDPFIRYGLRRIINASGTETALGASPVCPEVLAAVNALVPHSVDMLELQSVACRAVAAAFEAEAGLVVNCTAAGITMAVAACMTGENLARIERLPDSTGLKNEVILQRGHNINYGGSIAQNITMAGAKLIEIGAATECGAFHLSDAITPQTAAALFVVSHHTVQSGMVDLETFCQICRQHKVPVIVDAAAEPDPRMFLRAGADLVVVSMHKQFASLTAGAVAGRLDLIRACYHQERGVGRPMKVGKEAVIATIAALERWSALDRRRIAAALDARLAQGKKRLDRLPGITATIEIDSTSRLFSRLLIQVDSAAAGIDASALAAALSAQRPSISVRAILAELGLLQIDLRRASEETADHIVGSVEQIVSRRRGARRAAAKIRPAPNSADQALSKLKRFPLRRGI